MLLKRKGENQYTFTHQASKSNRPGLLKIWVKLSKCGFSGQRKEMFGKKWRHAAPSWGSGKPIFLRKSSCTSSVFPESGSEVVESKGNSCFAVLLFHGGWPAAWVRKAEAQKWESLVSTPLGGEVVEVDTAEWTLFYAGWKKQSRWEQCGAFYQDIGELELLSKLICYWKRLIEQDILWSWNCEYGVSWKLLLIVGYSSNLSTTNTNIWL